MKEEVEALYNQLKEDLDGLDGIAYEIVDNWLHDYCYHIVEVRKERAAMEREGSIIELPKCDRPNPRAAIIQKHEQQIVKLGKEIKTAVDKGGVASVDRLAAYVGR